MNKPAVPSRWSLPWRRVEARVANDPADQGTAFGLELSLEAERSARPAPAAPAAKAGWMHRLSLRRRAAT